MRAAEKLFARDGIENVSVRAIIREAGQRNESALHYHFDNKAGLVDAIHNDRIQQVLDHRERFFEVATAAGRKPDVREICLVMVEPPFQLCGRDRGFRDFISVFGQRLATSRGPVTPYLPERRSPRFEQIIALMREQLPHLDDVLFDLRIDNMSRFTMLAMSRRAKEGGTFRGRRAELFINDLADTMAGMLTGPVSPDTRAVLEDSKDS